MDSAQSYRQAVLLAYNGEFQRPYRNVNDVVGYFQSAEEFGAVCFAQLAGLTADQAAAINLYTQDVRGVRA